MDRKLSNMQPSSSATEQNLLEAFAERARAAAGTVSVVLSIEEAARVIRAAPAPTTGNYTATSSLLARFPGLRDSLSAEGIELRVVEGLQNGSEGPSATAARFAGDTALILGSAGVAETGSFLSAEDTLQARLLSMLADTVYVLLEASTIVATLDEMGRILSTMSREGRRYVSLVTGPSRTA